MVNIGPTDLAVVVPWAAGVAVLWLFFGPGDALNPFMWLITLEEFIEFVQWIVTRGSAGPFVEEFPSRETVSIVAGGLGLAGWAALVARSAGGVYRGFREA